VRIVADGLLGYNTDGPAALELLRRQVDPAGAAVALVGAGGTARAVAVSLREAGARVTLYGREVARVGRVAAALGVGGRSLGELAAADWTVLINATPLGSAGEQVLPAECLRGALVLDAVYGAHPTPLVRAARHRGIPTVDGFELLAAQAVLQFERLVGLPADAAIMAAAGKQWLDRRALDAPLPPE